jgi:hypothetical protein
MTTSVKNARRTTGIALVFLAFVLIATEFGILLHIRSLQPCGIGPMVQVSAPPEYLYSDDFRAVNGFSEEDLGSIMAIVRSDTLLSGDDPSAEKMYWAGKIRNWTRLQAQSIGTGITTRNPAQILDAMRNGSGASCEPLAILYLAALESVGLDGREVDLFVEPGSFDAAHTTVEVLTEYGWILQDPTFNAVPTGPDGSPMSAADVQAAYNAGEEVTWVQDFSETEPTMDSYSIPPNELYNYVFYRLYRYPYSMPRPRQWISRFSNRVLMMTECLLLTRRSFPAGEAVTDGHLDRVLVLWILIFLVTGVFSILTSILTSRTAREEMRK